MAIPRCVDNRPRALQRIPAGHETTRNAISGGLLALIEHPAALEQLQQDISLVPRAVEEMALSLMCSTALRQKGSGWGSRSVGCGVLLAGLPLASWWIGYPICAGRLTLFALLPLVVLTLEGVSFATGGVRRLPRGPWIDRG